MAHLTKALFLPLLLVIFSFSGSQALAAGFPDLDADTDVDYIDFQILVSQFNTSCSPNPCSGDYNNDNQVNSFDLNAFYATGYQNPLPSPTVSPTSSPPASPTPAPTLPPGSSSYIWLSPAEAATLPTNGEYWEELVHVASQPITQPHLHLRHGESKYSNTRTLAKALVYMRQPSHTCGSIGGKNCLAQVHDALDAVIGTEDDPHPPVTDKKDVLAVVRNTYSYVVAADLVNLENTKPSLHAEFYAWLEELPHKEVGNTGGCQGIIQCHEDRPNNFGTHSAASHISIALYLDDEDMLQHAADIHLGWLGDRTSYSDFNFNSDKTWHCDPSKPVGINPIGCKKSGHNIDGVLPDDQRRGGSFEWPPPEENYVYEALQGAVTATEMLYRAGVTRGGQNPYQWQNQAILRAFRWLYETDFKDGNPYPAVDDDRWLPFIINKRYNEDFPVYQPNGKVEDAPLGKGMAFASWTHQ